MDSGARWSRPRPAVKRVRAPTRDSRVEKWQRWLSEAIEPEILGLYWNREVYRTVVDIVNAREPKLPSTLFIDFIGTTYATTQAGSVRRVAEVSPRVRSLGELIHQISEAPEPLTRQRFVAQYDADDQDHGDAVFTSDFAGEVGDHVDPKLIEADLSKLTAESKAVTDFVDRHVAHLDLKPLDVLPTFEELHGAVDVLGDMFKRYYLLLNVTSWAQLVPVPQENWTAVFKEPWIIGSDD